MEINRTYGIATTVYFPLVDFGATDFEATPVTFATGDTTISKDGGTFTNSTNNPSHEGKGIYSLALTLAEMQAGIIAIAVVDQTGTKLWEDQAILISTGLGAWVEGNQSIIIGEVDTATFTSTTTAFEAYRLSPNDTEEATADHYNGRLITFTSGALIGQQTSINDYALANSKEKFTVTTMTEAPADAVRFIVT